MLVSYIYDYSNGKRPIGCMIARKTNKGHIQLGYSLCNPKDKFDKRTARLLAMKSTSPEIPQRNVTDKNGNIRPLVEVMEATWEKMGERVEKYFFNPKPKASVGKWCLFNAHGMEYVGFITEMNSNDYGLITADYIALIPGWEKEVFLLGAFYPDSIVEVY